MALAEVALSMSSQKPAKRRKGRPRRWERTAGCVSLTINLPSSLHVALEMLATTEHPMLAGTAPSMRGTDYAADFLFVHLAERFMEVFGVPIGNFLHRLSFALDSGVAPEFAVARVLADIRAAGGTQ